jgi:hypothetical protein
MTNCKECNRQDATLLIPIWYVPRHTKIEKVTICQTRHLFIQPISQLYDNGRTVYPSKIGYFDSNHAQYDDHVFCSTNCMLGYIGANYRNNLFRMSNAILNKK